MKVIEIKTPNCSHCKAIESQYNDLKKKFSNVEFVEWVYGIDDVVKEYMTKYNIKSAPTFIIEPNDIKVSFEELESKLVELGA